MSWKALVYGSIASVGIGLCQEARSATTPVTSPWPLPLEMRVPFEPTAFPSADRTYLTYELYLTNFGTAPLTLRRIEVIDAAASATEPIAAFEPAQLNTLLQRVGDPIVGDQIPAADDNSRRQLAAGASVVVYLSIALQRGAHVPDRLRHRLFTSDSTVEGATIGTRHTQLHVLGPPVEGANWQASGGPSNDSHHRRGILVMEGRAVISRRYAIDWLQIENGTTFTGDVRDKRSYHAYGKPGSVRVKVGDRVRRGQILARIGNSGDAREPHLHFEVTTSSTLMAGEGVPYLIDQYRVKSTDDAWQIRTRELPLKDMQIDFGQGRGELY